MARLQLMFQERRVSNRRNPTGLMPGKLKHNQLDIICRPVDVSRNGMGVISTAQLEPGDPLVLCVREQIIALQVAWGKPDFAKQDQYRYGLVTMDPNDDLEAVFIACGCLK